MFFIFFLPPFSFCSLNIFFIWFNTRIVILFVLNAKSKCDFFFCFCFFEFSFYLFYFSQKYLSFFFIFFLVLFAVIYNVLFFDFFRMTIQRIILRWWKNLKKNKRNFSFLLFSLNGFWYLFLCSQNSRCFLMFQWWWREEGGKEILLC